MHASRLAEHFQDLERQDHAARLGMWIFLGSEALLFAGLFAVYGAYRIAFAHDFVEAIAHNTLVHGTVNTYVLVTSSLVMAGAVHALRHGNSRRAGLFVAGTILLGLVFMTIKGFEYAHHFEQGIYPGRHYASAELTTNGARMFYTLYFLMTGLHAFHVLIGLVLLAWMGVAIGRGRLTPVNPLPLELSGLYWHFVDVLWLFLWPLLYLTR